MKKIRHIKAGAVLLMALSASITSCNKDTGALPTVSQVVVGYQGLSQMELSIIKTDYIVALSNKNTATGSDGNFTMFAPTNEAFSKIGLGNSQDLNALQKPFLNKLLKYHLSNGSTKADVLATGMTSLLEANVKKVITVRNNEQYVNGSRIISANVKADNGTIHVINRVLLASDKTLAQTASLFAQGEAFVRPELTFFAKAIVYADLVTELSDPTKSYTLFAPTDQAFKNLGNILGVAINQPSDIEKLEKATVKQLILNHVLDVGGKFTSQLYPGSVSTLSGKNIILGEYTNGLLSVKGNGNSSVSNMTIPDIQTTNGVMHLIDSVLLP